MVEKIRAIHDIKQRLVSNPIPTTTSPLEKHVRVPRKKWAYQRFTAEYYIQFRKDMEECVKNR